jgi:catechol-2,3-dioxygenase
MSYVIFEKPDLALMGRFLADFGMSNSQRNEHVLMMRGTGSDAYIYVAHRGDASKFLGFGVEVDSREDLTTLQKAIPHSEIEEMADVGAGSRLRLRDPNGFIVDVLHGRRKVPEIVIDRHLGPSNRTGAALRVNRPQRAPLAPSPVVRLGHVVLGAGHFALSAKWYMRNLGMMPSDVQYIANGQPALVFLRFDRGREPTDHHSIVLVAAPKSAYMHSAFETTDIDAIGQGAQVLRAAGWRHVWGIGRHILGSQIFDYWLDPYGHEVEHYADGDLFDSEYPTGYSRASTQSLWSWGHDAPSASPVENDGSLAENPAEADLHAGLRQAFAAPARPWLTAT